MPASGFAGLAYCRLIRVLRALPQDKALAKCNAISPAPARCWLNWTSNKYNLTMASGKVGALAGFRKSVAVHY